MVKVKLGDDVIQSKIRFKVRFDFKGEYKPGRFLFGGKSVEQAAQDSREEQIALLKNIPVQGVSFIDYDISLEPYVVYDDAIGERVAYAPAEITLNADSVEDMIRFVMREEFRKLEILEPSQMLITNNDLEKILFKMNEELKNQLLILSRKIKR
ncbi:conserved protein of unknown function [Tepidanaerobacter acetatoxydans Re1]|uniref:Uncharacterized protein n=1 Tax=Tepidanaerobacter acetatoxydans (strain DSM 21804 / JCM 16047 / Re1) TaxID=1209989 RepID=F4LUW6_TEPAE|nr:hypothetical protein [Tepidanaerobacter acetatoxydans]AEE91492.1 hypothetical protein TepRe1_1346 [Tepidanaerobacter acetatoxydans Re1]CCP26204.1 conserved protein of unknown function [Tepidanaerobacter acetatoxydans Re1]